ncbi:MAG: S8 family serine peptidase [Blastocatellia bacterium]|nr:S8 family serine peptidase [Blastocatellia bacterium]
MIRQFRNVRVIVLLTILLFAAAALSALSMKTLPSAAGAQAETTYVMTSAHWGDEQTAAVAAAGGVVTFSHPQTGIATVTSSAPGFLQSAMASGKFANGAVDQIVQWQMPIPTVELNADAITPGDETFINLQWNIKAVEAAGAWAAGYDGRGVRVAVIDGGIYNAHQDLDANIDVAASRSFVPGLAFNQDVGTFWHGTHVAGIIAAEDNGLGTIGIAPKATIIGVKALDNGSGSFGAVISALLYASTPLSEGGAGADIINMSLGATFPRGGGNTGAGQLIAALNTAVNFAGQHSLVVSSAGNDGLDLDHSGSVISVPAQSGSGIAISATAPVGYAVGYPNGATNFRRLASYSNFGNSAIWVAAPGGDSAYTPTDQLCSIPAVPTGSVVQPCYVFDFVLSTSRGPAASTTSYTFAAGTSMAAPAASAVAALIKQRFPNISVGDLKTRLAQTADDEGKVGHDPAYGHGFVNARRAVTE